MDNPLKNYGKSPKKLWIPQKTMEHPPKISEFPRPQSHGTLQDDGHPTFERLENSSRPVPVDRLGLQGSMAFNSSKRYVTWITWILMGDPWGSSGSWWDLDGILMNFLWDFRGFWWFWFVLIWEFWWWNSQSWVFLPHEIPWNSILFHSHIEGKFTYIVLVYMNFLSFFECITIV